MFATKLYNIITFSATVVIRCAMQYEGLVVADSGVANPKSHPKTDILEVRN